MADLSDSLRASITDLQLKHSGLLQAVQAYQGGSVSAAAAELRAATATVERMLESNATLTAQALAVDASTRAARDIAKEARDAAGVSEQAAADALAEAEALLARAESAAVSAEGYKASAEAAQAAAEALVEQPAVEADRAEAARNQAAVTALGVDNDKLMSIASVYGKPSISLDFLRQEFWKQGKYPWAEESAELTFTRSTPKWVFGPDGKLGMVNPDEMAFEYDPVTREPLGVLLESRSTNTISNSTDLTLWTRYAVNVVSSSEKPPLVGDTAYYISDSSDESRMHSIGYKDAAIIHEGETYTASVFVKAAESTEVYLSLGRPNEHRAFISYDLANGAKKGDGDTYGPYEFIKSSAKHVGNGWHHLSVTCGVAEGEGAVGIGMGIHTSATFSVKGVPGRGVIVFAPQLEKGEIASSYIPTTGGPVTRGRDSLDYKLGDEFNPLAGAISMAFKRKAVTAASSGNRFLGMSGTDGSLAYDYGTDYQIIRSYDNNNAPYVVPEIEADGTERFALSWANGRRTLVSGESISTSSDIREYQSATGLDFGSESTSMYVKYLRYYPRAMTEAELREVTS